MEVDLGLNAAANARMRHEARKRHTAKQRRTVEANALDSQSIARLTQELQLAVKRLSPQDRPAAIGLLAKPFSMQANELTPNLKLRRSTIEMSRRDELDRISAMVDAQDRQSAVTLIALMDRVDSTP